jgi:hypothetical protein
MNRKLRTLIVSSLVFLTSLAVPAVVNTAQANDAVYCDRLIALAKAGALYVQFGESDSPSSAAAKVAKVRANYLVVGKVAPSELKPTYRQAAAILALMRNDLLALRKASRSRIEVAEIEADAILRCAVEDLSGNGSSGSSGTEGSTPEISSPPTVSPTIPKGLLSGTGVYEIGKDISPGPWTTRGGVNCVAGLTNDPTGQDATEGFVTNITKGCPGWRAGTLA